jgi:hypothetical protein
MALLDHFHPPLKGRRHWHSFHNGWAMSLAAALNKHLPPGYFAEPNVVFGVEVDVAALEDGLHQKRAESLKTTTPGGASATPQLVWASPLPSGIIPFFPTTESVEVNIFNTAGDLTLIGAIELVSPANKDRQEHRDVFVSKCMTYLSQGIGLVIVDVVTERTANLHNELLDRLGNCSEPPLAGHLYSAAYRVIKNDDNHWLSFWQEALEVGKPLPTVPLWLREDICQPVELQSSYDRVCQELKLDDVLTLFPNQ